MQDRELIAAIVAGDPGGLAEAYDRYAAALYTYCRFMLPDPHPPGAAADAVADTFIIAAAKLPGLRDPGQLRPWLHAVARNECLRQLEPAVLAVPAGAAGLAGRAGGGARPALDDAMREASLPADLRERVLAEGADNTPAGRAHRVSVTHRAGPFGPTGFPKPVIPPGPRWWHEVRRHPLVAVAVAAVAAAVVVAGVAALLIAGGPHRARASTVALGGGDFQTSAAVSSPAGGPTSPSRKPTPAAGTSSASRSPADGPTAGQRTSPGTSRSPTPARSSPSPSPSRSPSASPSPSPSPSPTPGTLRVSPNKLVLTAVLGKPGSGTFILTAAGGPVNFLIHSPNAKVTVSPASGSLRSAGSWVTITVTVRSLVAVNARVIVGPGNVVVTVVFTIKV